MSPLARVLGGLVRAYQLVVSPWVAVSCRYYPSCSAYALEAIQLHGAVRGTGLAARRLLRCHPWARGGVDHVPGHVSHDETEPGDVEAHPDLITVPTGTPTEPART